VEREQGVDLGRTQQIPFGIVIAMYFGDHNPPHFHAKYGEYEISVDIADGVVSGRFPRRALKHVMEWYELHKAELEENWQLAQERKPLIAISPLE